MERIIRGEGDGGEEKGRVGGESEREDNMIIITPGYKSHPGAQASKKQKQRRVLESDAVV